jgi:thiol-disulfide isomerase/thioredoxin
VLLALWQAGVVFQDDGSNSTLDLQPADTSLQTPGFDSRKTGSIEGSLAPDFAFSSFQGERLRLSDFRGQPVLINFWASWCGPCRTEMPDLESALQRYSDQRLVIIGVNYGERFEPARAFIQELDVELTAFAYDPDQAIARSYEVQGLPTSFFIDRDGVIVQGIAGQLTPRLLESGISAALAGHAAVSQR